jgi:hypothetical protein
LSNAAALLIDTLSHGFATELTGRASVIDGDKICGTRIRLWGIDAHGDTTSAISLAMVLD